VAATDPHVFDLADNPNTFTPLGPGEERIEDERFVLYMGRRANWNVAQRFRFEAGEVDAVRSAIHELLRDRGRTGCAWEIGSAARPQGLEQLLLARGLTVDEDDHQQTGMVLDSDPGPAPPGIAVRVAQTWDDHASAERIATRAFGGEEPTPEQVDELLATRDPARVRRYLASIGGQDVASATATFAEHGVVLNAGATLPEWRGRGAYRALVRARFDDAVAAGTPVLVTQAGAMSRPTLERMGFRAVCRVVALHDRFGGGGDAS